MSLQETEAMIGDKFVMDIRNFVSEVSDHAEPACLMLFGVNYTFSGVYLCWICIQFYAYVCVCVFMLHFVGGYSCHRTYHSKIGYEYCLVVHFFSIFKTKSIYLFETEVQSTIETFHF